MHDGKLACETAETISNIQARTNTNQQSITENLQ